MTTPTGGQMIDQVRDTLRRASKVVETPRRRTEEAVRKMAENPNFDLMDAPQLAIDLLKRGREHAGKVQELLDQTLRRGLSGMGVATKDEIDRLNQRIAELEAAAAGASGSPRADTGSAPKRRPARQPFVAPATPAEGVGSPDRPPGGGTSPAASDGPAPAGVDAVLPALKPKGRSGAPASTPRSARAVRPRPARPRPTTGDSPAE